MKKIASMTIGLVHIFLSITRPIFASSQLDQGLAFLSLPYISSIFVILGLVCLVLEIVTPGFGLGALMSAVFFAIFFFTTVATGLASIITVFVFILGVLLIGIEIAVPGFGLPGIGGTIAILGSIVLAMESLELALITLAISFLLSFGLSYYLLQRGLQSQWLEQAILENKSHPKLKEDPGFAVEVGDIGVCINNLRPSGTCLFGDQERSVLSEQGKFIAKGSLVEVTKIFGWTIYVKEKKNG